MPIKHLPEVFIGCAIEDKGVADALQQRLDHVAEAQIWTDGVFVPTTAALASLIASSARVDFAVLIANAQDTLSTRGTTFVVPRDNVMFEFGLFLGALGHERTFLICNRGNAAHLPTDLGGITTLDYDGRKSNMVSAIGAAGTSIEAAIAALGMR